MGGNVATFARCQSHVRSVVVVSFAVLARRACPLSAPAAAAAAAVEYSFLRMSDHDTGNDRALILLLMLLFCMLLLFFSRFC